MSCNISCSSPSSSSGRNYIPSNLVFFTDLIPFDRLCLKITGWFQVFLSLEFPLVHQKDESGGESDDDEATSTTASSQSYRDLSFDAAEFKAAVIQILNLLMDEKFSHPYGTVAGSVA